MVVVFVVAGVSYRGSTIKALHGGAQAMQIANLNVKSVFLDSQRAVQGFQATREGRFLQTFYDDQDQFVLALSNVRQLAWAAVLNGVSAEARAALATFQVGDRAVTAPAGSSQAAQLYSRASASSDGFVSVNNRLERQLASASNAFAAASGRTLGMGLVGTTVILMIGVLLPVALGAIGVRWASVPLHEVTRMVRRRALGNLTVRAAPRGPADIRELSASVNFLADESDRLTAIEHERLRLQSEVREASTRIRKHLRADDLVREVGAAIQQHLSADSVWVVLVSAGRLTLAEGDGGTTEDTPEGTTEQAAAMAAILPDDAVAWLTDLYHRHEAYYVQDLRLDGRPEIPDGIRRGLLELGTASLVVAPFGAGAQCLGGVCLVRNDPGQPWSGPQKWAVEAVAEDIGRGLEHARLYEAEERLVTELKSLDQARTSFLAYSSHDLRTPLISITGYLEMMLDGEAGPIPPVQAKMLQVMDRNSRRLLTLIEDMLTISRMEFGAFTSRLQPVDMTALVAPAADVLRPTAAAKGLTFEVDCPGQSLMVEGDPHQLDRLITNLLSNAMKFTPRGGKVTLRFGRDGSAALLTVADTGMGIPEQDQGSIFTRFFRASNAVALEIPGSGLGLSIVQTIVRNHDGDVELKSGKDKGTTVTIRIPLLAGGQRADNGSSQGSGFSEDSIRVVAAPAEDGGGPAVPGPGQPGEPLPGRVRGTAP
jgi:signal transduction histidine kinase